MHFLPEHFIAPYTKHRRSDLLLNVHTHRGILHFLTFVWPPSTNSPHHTLPTCWLLHCYSSKTCHPPIMPTFSLHPHSCFPARAGIAHSTPSLSIIDCPQIFPACSFHLYALCLPCSPLQKAMCVCDWETLFLLCSYSALQQNRTAA